jgi:hypothetical protein
MRLDETSGRNDTALARIRSVIRDHPPLAAPDSVADAYAGQGSHPDVVERLWDGLAAGLPMDCRCLVAGTPALVHPGSGVVLAFTLGTAYYVRRPPGSDLDAPTDAEAGDLGPEWDRGSWSDDEPARCGSTYDALEHGS